MFGRINAVGIRRGLFLCLLGVALAQDHYPGSQPAEGSADNGGTAGEPAIAPVRPTVEMLIVQPKRQSKPEPVQWKSLFKQSLTFMTIENGWRYATERATRSPGMPFFKGYVDSVTNMHGWADGNPFLDNYIGHPMQGAASGLIWIQNDPRYRNVEFGRNPEYWRSRLRAGAYMWAYSTLLELGPFSEASIGNIQAKIPEQGLVDHVITPLFGLGWLIGEDALDRFVIRRLEMRTNNRVYRILLRGCLNPTRSFSNVIGGRLPWRRLADEELRFRPAPSQAPSRARRPVEPLAGVAPFELGVNSYFLQATNGPCIGGGATAAFRIHPQWQIVGDLNGCTMNGLQKNFSGDYMTYVAGPRWTPLLNGRWKPYLQVLAGGSKATQELMMPELKAELERQASRTGGPVPDATEYTRQFDTAGYAISAGAGLDLHLNQAFAIRLASVDYTRAWIQPMPGFAAPGGIQLKFGVALRVGTW